MSLISGSLEIRCPRNSKNNDGNKCYCNNYIHPLYHGTPSKSVLCCYADGECCYQSTCRYSHIKANSLALPCIFELNGRRCNNPKKCIFALGCHTNRRIPKKYDQVYRYDIKHNQSQSRFPRSKKVIDTDFDNNNNNNNNSNSNSQLNNAQTVQIQTVYVPVPVTAEQQMMMTTHQKRKVGKNNNGVNNNNTRFGRNLNIGVPSHTIMTKRKSGSGGKKGKNVKRMENGNNLKNEIYKKKELEIDEMDEIDKEIEAEIKEEIKAEIARSKEQHERKGLPMPFSDKIKIKQRVRDKFENIKKQLKENQRYYAKNVNQKRDNNNGNVKIEKKDKCSCWHTDCPSNCPPNCLSNCVSCTNDLQFDNIRVNKMDINNNTNNGIKNDDDIDNIESWLETASLASGLSGLSGLSGINGINDMDSERMIGNESSDCDGYEKFGKINMFGINAGYYNNNDNNININNNNNNNNSNFNDYSCDDEKDCEFDNVSQVSYDNGGFDVN